MSRLLHQPDIEWQKDDTPVSGLFGDIYFSAQDGLEESRNVFLAGCGLPEAWAGRDHFTIAETGFGTGLNFLAVWQLWRTYRPALTARLSFVSFEGFPLKQADAARALRAWPELAPMSARLLAAWPGPVRGVRRLCFDDEGVELILHLGEISETLPDSDLQADAWFLDGFSPSRNLDMWQEALYPRIAERSAPRARLASFTVAGHVRRGLEAAGFEVRRCPGFGRKRHRLEASRDGACEASAKVRRVAILGAGISGAALASEFTRSGVEAVVFDPAPVAASGASGNPLALMMPRLDAADTPEARLMIDAYLCAQARYAGQPGCEQAEVLQSARDDRDVRRFTRLAADPPLPPEDLRIGPGALVHRRALIIRPPVLISALLSGAEQRYGRAVQFDPDRLRVDGEPFDAIILAPGASLSAFLPEMRLTGRLGQVEYLCAGSDEEPRGWACGHYALQSGFDRLWGASFDPVPQDGMPVVLEDARERNMQALKGLGPGWGRDDPGGGVVSRASVRATTPDRLPLIGRLPAGQGGVPGPPAIWLAGGFGSRGFTWAPWAASVICARITGRPVPAALSRCMLVDPSRHVLRR